jgi:hypothetical protein
MDEAFVQEKKEESMYICVVEKEIQMNRKRNTKLKEANNIMIHLFVTTGLVLVCRLDAASTQAECCYRLMLSSF